MPINMQIEYPKLEAKYQKLFYEFEAMKAENEKWKSRIMELIGHNTELMEESENNQTLIWHYQNLFYHCKQLIRSCNRMPTFYGMPLHFFTMFQDGATQVKLRKQGQKHI